MVVVAAALLMPFTSSLAAGGPAISLAPSSGPAGTSVAVSGTGLAAKTRLQITWDGSADGFPAVSVNARGGFKVTITVPVAAAGAHTLATSAVAKTGPAAKASKNSQLGSILASTTFTLASAAASPTDQPPATPDPTPRATSTPAPAATPTPTPKPAPTDTPAAAATPTATATPTPTTAPTPTAPPTPTAQPTPTATPAGTTAPVAGARALGVYVHDSAWNHALLDAYATQVGRKPSFAGTFHEFSSTRSDGGELFPDYPNGYAPQVSELTAWAARGIVPVLTWQPLADYANGPDAAYTLLTITAGNHDAEINAWATAAAAYGKPLYIRFAHEMNGDWYPWGQHINGNTPAQYVAAWRYVVNKFRAAGATNVKWIWSPNVLYGNTWPITGLYPGDSYVDVIGMDGYNWGTSGDGPVGWFSFTTLFAGLYDQVRALAPSKPIIVAEVNTAESGGDKAAWIKSAFLTEIPTRFPAVRGVMWFDTTGGFDPNWSITTSSSALTAFRTVVADAGWQGTLP